MYAAVGDEIAIYFCYLGSYVGALVYPAILGVVVAVAQMVAGRIDDNPLHIPWTVFFASWS